MNYILHITTTNQYLRLNKEEANLFASTPQDQSIAFKRFGACIQKRLCNLLPINHSDVLNDRKKQQTGVLHDGSKAKKHFGQWVADLGDVPDDGGNYHPVKLDPQYYPEIALDIVATEDEWREIQKTKIDYYEFLGISDKIKRLDNKKGFTKLLE